MAEQTALTQLADGKYQLSGELDFSSVVQLHAASEQLFADNGDIVVDLAAVERANSAGLGLLIDWLRMAELQNRAIEFHNPPDDIAAVAKLCELDKVLPFK